MLDKKLKCEKSFLEVVLSGLLFASVDAETGESEMR